MSSLPPDVEGSIEGLIREALGMGSVEAEVFVKVSRGRRVALEPALVAGGRPRITTSRSVEDGMALRVRDRDGRWGFSWESPAGPDKVHNLVERSMAAARRPPASSDDGPGWAAPPATANAGRGATEDAAPEELGIVDPGMMAAPAERLIALLDEAADTARSLTDGVAEVDRVVLSAADTTVTLANSLGFRGRYAKSMALLSVSMVPSAAGASPALEERSACRLLDLDPRECGREAAARALPARPAAPPPSGDLPLILAPRAAASFLAALLPWILAGRDDEGRVAAGRRGEREPTAGCLSVVDDGRLPGGFGTTPFDGVGRPTRRTTLLASGQRVGRLSLTAGHLVRHSFRDSPALGPANPHVVPAPEIGALLVDPLLDPIGDRLADRVNDRSGACLLVRAARFVPGPVWRVRVLKGDWQVAGSPAGAADGIAWEGPLERLIEGIAAAGPDLRFFHLGLPVGAPSLRIEGLTPWIVESAGMPIGGPLARPARSPERMTGQID